MTASLPEFWGLTPLWITVAGFLSLLLWEVLFREEGRKAAPVLAGAFLTLALAFDFYLLSSPVMPGPLFHGAVVVDLYSLTLQAVCLVSALLTCVFSSSYLHREKAVTGEYYALLLSAAGGMLTLVLASDFLTLFVGLEWMSLSGYILAGYLRVREKPVEAALKYFLMGVFASGFLLYGIAVLYGLTGSLHFPDIRSALEKGPAGSLLAAWAAVLLLVGLGFKVAVAPFHAWAPDVYDGAPAPVSAFLSTGVKAAGFGVLTRLLTEILGVHSGWITALPWIAVLTMFAGNLGALAQDSVKRMMAYSSVAHAGYVMVALSTAAVAPADEVERSVAFYLLAYTLMTAGAFGWLAWAGGKGEEKSRILDFQGLGLERPWMGLAMAVFLFSLAGMTPTAGFFGKYYLFKLAVDRGLTWLAVLAVLNSLLSAYYYLRVAAILFIKSGREGREEWPAPTLGLKFGLFLCALGTVLVGFFKFPF